LSWRRRSRKSLRQARIGKEEKSDILMFDA